MTQIAILTIALFVGLMLVCFLRDAIVEHKRELDKNCGHVYYFPDYSPSYEPFAERCHIACVIPIDHYTNEQLIPLIKEWAAFRGLRFSDRVNNPEYLIREKTIAALNRDVY